MWSMGILNLRAKFCLLPVRKACVKKKPLIQYTAGAPQSTQSCDTSAHVTQDAAHECREVAAWRERAQGL